MSYKSSILDKTIKKTQCIKKLELEHSIKISSATLNKILNESY